MMDLSAPEAQDRIKRFREWRVLVNHNPSKYRIIPNRFYSQGYHLLFQEFAYSRGELIWQTVDSFKTVWHPPLQSGGKPTYERL